MKKAFTLVEVLIASMIVFIAVFALLNLCSNMKFMIGSLTDMNIFNLKSSVALIEQKNVKTLYEQLSDFNITDDEIIHDLKREKIYLKKTKQKTVANSLIITFIKAYNKYYSNTAVQMRMK